MKRVVVTGMGIVSCIGNDIATVTESLKAGKSGIRFNPTYAELGMRSHVSGTPDINLADHIDRKAIRFMGDAAGYAYVAMAQAIADSGLTEAQVSNPRAGLIAGSGGADSQSQTAAADILREKRPQACRPLSCHSDNGLYRVGLSGHTVPDQGR